MKTIPVRRAVTGTPTRPLQRQAGTTSPSGPRHASGNRCASPLCDLHAGRAVWRAALSGPARDRTVQGCADRMVRQISPLGAVVAEGTGDLPNDAHCGRHLVLRVRQHPHLRRPAVHPPSSCRASTPPPRSLEVGAPICQAVTFRLFIGLIQH